MLNVEIIYDLIKDCKHETDDTVFNKLLLAKQLFKQTDAYVNIVKMRKINQGESKQIYLSNDNMYVYKIRENTTNLFLSIEEIYLLNKIFKTDFAMDIVSIEKIDTGFVFIFQQPYYKEVDFLSKIDILKLKAKLHAYMTNLGYKFNMHKSENRAKDFWFMYIYYNDKYIVFDFTPYNITLVNGELFFYDINLIKLEYFQNYKNYAK